MSRCTARSRRMAWPRHGAYGLRARIPTIATRRDMSGGFGMWYWNPAFRTLARVSGSMRAVRQAAGVRPPRSGTSARTRSREHPRHVLEGGGLLQEAKKVPMALVRPRQVVDDQLGLVEMHEGEQVQRAVLDIGEVSGVRDESIGFEGCAKRLDEVRPRIEDRHAAPLPRSGQLRHALPPRSLRRGRRSMSILVRRRPARLYWTLVHYPATDAGRL